MARLKAEEKIVNILNKVHPCNTWSYSEVQDNIHIKITGLSDEDILTEARYVKEELIKNGFEVSRLIQAAGAISMYIGISPQCQLYSSDSTEFVTNVIVNETVKNLQERIKYKDIELASNVLTVNKMYRPEVMKNLGLMIPAGSYIKKISQEGDVEKLQIVVGANKEVD